MHKFYAALFNGKIIGEETLAKMLVVFPAPEMAKLKNVKVNEFLFGSGIFSARVNGKIFYFRTGETIAYESAALYNMTDQTYFILICNSMESDCALRPTLRHVNR